MKIPRSWGRSLLFLCLAALWLPTPASAKPVPTPTFLAGGDLSVLAREEQLGAVYKDKGKPRDALQIFKSQGWNVVRLRLWVHPTRQGDHLNDLPYTIALAKRAKQAGFQVLLDLHYSDYWADPGSQTKPAAWKDLPFDQLTQQVQAYSRDVLRALRVNGAMPDIVAVGNETINGMLWPDGHVEERGGWERYGTLLKAGIAGVREGTKPLHSPQIMVHINNGADSSLTQWFFEHLDAEKQGINFDLIGLSYYPDGKNTLGQLRDALTADARKYRKPIVVTETAYPAEGTPRPEQSVYAQYGMTPDGQRRFLADLVKTVQAVPGGLGRGVIYWQPEWVSRPGLRSYSDANALFDAQLNARPALGALAPTASHR